VALRFGDGPRQQVRRQTASAVICADAEHVQLKTAAGMSGRLQAGEKADSLLPSDGEPGMLLGAGEDGPHLLWRVGAVGQGGTFDGQKRGGVLSGRQSRPDHAAVTHVVSIGVTCSGTKRWRSVEAANNGVAARARR